MGPSISTEDDSRQNGMVADVDFPAAVDPSNAFPAPGEDSRPTGRIWPFLIWLVGFYAIWLTIVIGGNLWGTVVDHWPIAIAMALGSYVAGSTPMGGGTVGFPVLVLLMDLPGSMGRNFGLAVQSVGMVSASIYLLSRRQPLSWHLLRPVLIGSTLGTPLGAMAVAPLVPDLWIKLIFAILWASFGVMHLLKMTELMQHQGLRRRAPQQDQRVGLAVGILGGLVSSVTGVGIDMLLYAWMVLLHQADLKIAIPTSVLAMAYTSVLGIATNLLLAQTGLACYRVSAQVGENWLAAAPIVAIGAPFGALVVERISRRPTLVLVSALCLFQFGWTLIQQQVSGGALAASLAGVAVLSGLFHSLYHWGRGEDVWGRNRQGDRSIRRDTPS